jgi:Flp pilus assembly protein TadB
LLIINLLRAVVNGLLASSQYPEGPALTGHLGTGFSWFPCVEKRMLRWFQTLESCYCMLLMWPSGLEFLDPGFTFMYMHNNHCHRATAHWQLNLLLLLSGGTVCVTTVIFCAYHVGWMLALVTVIVVTSLIMGWVAQSV